MKMSITFDSHKRYTLVFVEEEKDGRSDEARIKHERGPIPAAGPRRAPAPPVAKSHTIHLTYGALSEMTRNREWGA